MSRLASILWHRHAVNAFLLVLLPFPVLAVGTWGGAEPPTGDYSGGSIPWWGVPLIIAFVAAQIYLGGKMFAVAGVVLVGATVAKWFGATAGWMAAIIFAAWMYWTIFANTTPKQAAPTQPDNDPRQNSPAMPSDPPKEATQTTTAPRQDAAVNLDISTPSQLTRTI